MKKINVRVEFESTPVRHLAVQCPECTNWFYGYDVCNNEIRYEHQLSFMDCSCPKCGHDFEGTASVEECGHPEVYRDILKKKTEWV